MSADSAVRTPEQIVLVAGPQVHAAPILETFAAWSRAGLLKEVLWVDHADLEQFEPRIGADLEAILVGPEPRPVLLFRELARSRAPVVRLVCLHLLPDGSSAVDGLAAAAHRLREELELRLAGGQRRPSLNLVVPSSITSDLPDEVLLRGWNANVVVAPEDRRSDQQADQGVRPDTNYAVHSALGTATLAGIWRSMGSGPLDRQQPPPGERRHLFVARSFARVLLGTGVADELLAWAFEARRGQVRSLAVAAGGEPASHPERVIAAAADTLVQALGGGAFTYRRRPRPRRIEVPRLSLGQTATAIGRFVGSGFRDLPFTRFRTWEQRVDTDLRRWAQSLLPNGGASATEGGSGEEEAAAWAGGDPIAIARGEARELLAGMRGEGEPGPVPDVWRELRATCFGLVDGGPLPSYLEEPRVEGHRTVVLAPDQIATGPTHPPFLPATFLPGALADDPRAKEAVRTCDPYHAEYVRLWLKGLANTQQDQADAHPVQSALRQLDLWTATTRGSLCWRVAEGLAAALAAARADFSRVKEEVTTEALVAAPERTVRSARRRLRMQWALAAAVGLLGPVVAILWSLRSSPATGWLVAGVAGSLLAWLGGSLAAFLGCQRQLGRITLDHERSTAEFVWHLEGARSCAREMVRLAALYEQLRDWAEVLGWLVHRPEGQRRAVRSRAEPAHQLRHPLALCFATGCQTPESSASLRAETIAQLFPTGWLTETYGTYLRAAEPHLEEAAGGRAIDPDVDLHGRTRTAFRMLLRDDALAEVWWARSRFELGQWLGRKSAFELFPLVEPIVPPGEVAKVGSDLPTPERHDARAFLAELLPSPDSAAQTPIALALWAPNALQRHAHYSQQTMIWAPPSAFPRDGANTRPSDGVTFHVTGPVNDAASDVYVLSVIRLDLAREVPSTDLLLFAASRRGEAGSLEGRDRLGLGELDAALQPPERDPPA